MYGVRVLNMFKKSLCIKFDVRNMHNERERSLVCIQNALLFVLYFGFFFFNFFHGVFNRTRYFVGYYLTFNTQHHFHTIWWNIDIFDWKKNKKYHDLCTPKNVRLLDWITRLADGWWSMVTVKMKIQFQLVRYANNHTYGYWNRFSNSYSNTIIRK